MVWVVDDDVSSFLTYSVEHWKPANLRYGPEAKWESLPVNKRDLVQSKKVPEDFDRTNFEYDLNQPGQRFLFFQHCALYEVEPPGFKKFVLKVLHGTQELFACTKEKIDAAIDYDKEKVWVGYAAGASVDGDLRNLSYLLPPGFQNIGADLLKQVHEDVLSQIIKTYKENAIKNGMTPEEIDQDLKEKSAGFHVSLGYVVNPGDLLNHSVMARVGLIVMWGLKIGMGGSADAGINGQIFIGYNDIEELSAYKPTSFDINLVLGATLSKIIGKVLKQFAAVFKQIRLLGKITETQIETIGNLTGSIQNNYYGNLNQDKKYELVFPKVGVGFHLWKGMKDAHVYKAQFYLPRFVAKQMIVPWK